jgi:O-acetyl-ADP-ribose deacetylase
MKFDVHGNTLQLIVGDITKQTTDAIVNAANGSLLGGGGVDGAIHKASGPELLKECKQIRKEKLKGEYLPTGEAVITKGYQLPAKYVIHTVGPIWTGDNVNEKNKLLANCYINSLSLAKKYHLQSISFPSISTGVYRFPIDSASKIALTTIVKFLQKNNFGTIVMTLFTKGDFEIYLKSAFEILEQNSDAS